MDNLHQTMTRPVNQDEFNQWVREFRVSSLYNDYETKQMVLREENRRFKSEDYRTNKSKQKQQNSLVKLLNTIPKTLMINSYLSFLLPSFIKSFTMDITSFGNLIFIYPLNMDDKYIVFDYYC